MRADEYPLNQSPWSRWTHCGFALIAIAFATLIRFPLRPLIGDASPFLFYFPVVLVIALSFGLKPGLVATAASVIPANYFWMLPEGAFSVGIVESCQMLAFSIAGCSVSWLSEAFHKQRQQKEHLRATLASIGDAIITTDSRGRIVYLNAMAEVLTELRGSDAIGTPVGDVLNIVNDETQQSMDGAFQMALGADEIEKLPRRITIISKTGRRHRVEQKISRILDPCGQRLGLVILYHS